MSHQLYFYILVDLQFPILVSYTPFPSLFILFIYFFFIVFFKGHFIPSLTSENTFDLCPSYVDPSFIEHILTFWNDKML